MNPIVRMMKRYIKMPLKYALPLLFIGALVLSSTTGCTVSTKNQASEVSTAYPTAGKRSELLQAFAADYNESGSNYQDFRITWINDTALTIHEKKTSVDAVITWDYKFIHFPTIDAATAYFDSHRFEYNNKPSYIDHASLYSLVTGAQNVSVVKEVTLYSTPTDYHLEQFDSLIIETASQYVTINQA
jgi:hypothetical protein